MNVSDGTNPSSGSDSMGSPGSSGPGDTNRQSPNLIEQIIGLLGAVDPIDMTARAIDASRRTTEALIGILEGMSTAVDNLNRTTGRINSLLDDIEEPLRRVMPQVGASMNAIATLGEAANQLGELAKRLSPLAGLAEGAGGLFGFRSGTGNQPPKGGATSSSPRTE